MIQLGVGVEGLTAGANINSGGQGNCCDGGESTGKGQKCDMAKRGLGTAWEGWGWLVGVLPVALAPTGSNLEQTVPNVFIRL